MAHEWTKVANKGNSVFCDPELTHTMKLRYDYILFRKNKMPNNQVVLDKMVDALVDKMSEIFSARKYFR